MDLLGLMSLTLAIVCSCFAGIIFIIYKAVEEEREKAQREAMVKICYKHYKKDGTEHKGTSHKMPDGSLHSNKSHTKTSVKLYHLEDLSAAVRKQIKARRWWLLPEKVKQK